MNNKVTVLLTWTTLSLGILGAAPPTFGDDSSEEEKGSEQEQVRAALNEIKQNKLVTILELPGDDEQTFLTLYNHWEEVRWEYSRMRNQLVEELRGKMADPPLGRDLDSILDDLDAADAQGRAKEAELRSQFRTVLSDMQYAKLLLFEDNFNRNLRRLVQERQRMALDAVEPASKE